MATPQPASSTVRPVPSFRERLWPGPLGWVGVVLFCAVLGIALVPVDGTLALVVGVVALAVAVPAAALTAAPVEVTEGTLRAGAARIPAGLLAEPRVLDRDGVRTEMGPALDARAYVCLRAWIGSAVRVEVDDPQDPTPYWIVSTRRPAELVAALRAAGTRTAGDPEG